MRGVHVPRIAGDGHVSLVSITEPDPKQFRPLIKQWSTPIARYGDAAEMLRNEKLDAVMIGSPHALHFEQARLALEKNLHVMVEKPLTISSRDSAHLLRLVKRKNRMLLVSYQRHFSAPYVYGRELIRRGTLGELRGVVSYISQDWSEAEGWRLDPKMSGGGMFMDTGSHLVAATLWMTGLEPIDVHARMDLAGMKADINAVVNVRFKSGALGTLNTFGNAAFHDECIAIHGSRGVLTFHQHGWQIRQVLLNNKPLKVPARVKDTTPDAAFFRWIRNGGRGYELPHFALQVARVSEAAVESAGKGRTVRVAKTAGA